MQKQQDIEWQLDLKPARRTAGQSFEPRKQAEEAHGDVQQELLTIIKDLHSKVDDLNARLAAVEAAFAVRAVHPAPSTNGSNGSSNGSSRPGAANGAPRPRVASAPRRERAARLRSAPTLAAQLEATQDDQAS